MDERTIKVRRGFESEELLEVVLHECIHAQRWELDDEMVTDMAEELAAILTNLKVVLEYPPTRRKRK